MNDRPNILFFFTDDQRFDTIRALGNPHIHTPAMDELVREGCSFTQAHIMGGTCPAVCMPSRAMLMTGRTLMRLENHGASIPETHTLLGEHLLAHGYQTCGLGKWHNGKSSYARSFSDGGAIFFGGMTDHWNVPCYAFDPSGSYAEADKVVQNNYHSSELIADEAIRFLDRRDPRKPFFCYTSFLAPHDPRTMPGWFRSLYPDDAIPLPENYLSEHPFDNGELKIRDELLAGFPRTPDEILRHQADYYAMITHLDFQLGRVVEHLKKIGQYENTLIVLAGDNGLAVGRHGLMGKQNCYDHSLRVPLIFNGPGIPKNTSRETCCYLLDIFPALCDLLHLPIPASVEGISLGPSLAANEQVHRDTLFFAYKHLQRAVRQDRFKLIGYAVNGQYREQLFDLASDPHERNDLSEHEAHRERRMHLRQLLNVWPTQLGDIGEQGRQFWALAERC